MADLCIRCGVAPIWPGDWLHCEPCFQDVCNEIHEAEIALDEGYDYEPDAIGRLMLAEGVGFIKAVERLARERGLK
jgi:hypothetical protein